MERVSTPELIDDASCTPSDVADSLVDLARINRWFGGVAMAARLVETAALRTRRRAFTMLDVAAGTPALSAQIQRRLAGRGIQLHIVALDRFARNLSAVGGALEEATGDAKPGETSKIACIAGDALALPFAGGSFDLVSSSTFLHHLDQNGAVNFLNEALRVCRLAVLINDIRRGRLHYGLARAAGVFLRKLSRYDAPVSVRAAYTPRELAGLIAQVRPAPAAVTQSQAFLFRMGAVLFRA